MYVYVYSFMSKNSKSFIYVKNNVGPKTIPCGTPYYINMID